MHTSHGGNVGAAARAMKVMGFSDLVLVQPRFADVLSREDTVAMASGAADILARARIVATLSEALDGIHHACATAMTPRDFGPPTHAPREHFRVLMGSALRVAFVFGSERFGMSNDDVYRCHACLSIPTDARYGSLNLAQAVQLIAYEWRMALGGFAVEPRTPDAALADMRGGAGRRRPLGSRAGATRLPGLGRAEEADAATAAVAEPRAAHAGRSAHPAWHRAGDRTTPLTGAIGRELAARRFAQITPSLAIVPTISCTNWSISCDTEL